MDVLKHFINYTCVRISYFECLCNWLQTWNPLLNNSWNFGCLASSRVKTLLIGLDLALEWSKLSSDMALATEITEHIWSVFTILRPSKLLQVKLLFFLVILTPKKENKCLTQFEPGRCGWLVWIWPLFGCIKTWDTPFSALFYINFEIAWPVWVVPCPNDQKKIEFDLQAWTWLQNHQNQSSKLGAFSENGHFLKRCWPFWSQT